MPTDGPTLLTRRSGVPGFKPDEIPAGTGFFSPPAGSAASHKVPKDDYLAVNANTLHQLICASRKVSEEHLKHLMVTQGEARGAIRRATHQTWAAILFGSSAMASATEQFACFELIDGSLGAWALGAVGTWFARLSFKSWRAFLDNNRQANELRARRAERDYFNAQTAEAAAQTQSSLLKTLQGRRVPRESEQPAAVLVPPLQKRRAAAAAAQQNFFSEVTPPLGMVTPKKKRSSVPVLQNADWQSGTTYSAPSQDSREPHIP